MSEGGREEIGKVGGGGIGVKTKGGRGERRKKGREGNLTSRKVKFSHFFLLKYLTHFFTHIY